MLGRLISRATGVTAVAVAISFLVASSVVAEVPQLINYQGYLTDSSGNPVADNEYTVTFTMYAGSLAVQIWSSGMQEVLVVGGLFNYQLGSAVPLPDDIFAPDSLIWLGITVDGAPEITPRTRLVSVPFAFHSLRADTATVALSGTGGGGWTDDGSIVRLISSTDSVGIGTDSPSEKLEVDGNIHVTGKANIGSGNNNGGANALTVGLDHTVSGDASSVGGGESDTVAGNYSVVSGGKFNSARGDYNTIGGGSVNITEKRYATVGGGFRNEATDSGATVAGGFGNRAYGLHNTIAGGSSNFTSDTGTFIGGGTVNTAIGHVATLCGGNENIASGDGSFVGGGAGVYAQGDYSVSCGGALVVADGDFSTGLGGFNNYAFGDYAVTAGGANNFASANYTFAAGYRANASHRSCFVWSDSSGNNFESTSENQFLIRAAGGVGIGTDTPQGALDVSSTTGAFLVPRMTTEQRDLLSAVNGMIIYNTTTDQFNFHENGLWVTK